MSMKIYFTLSKPVMKYILLCKVCTKYHFDFLEMLQNEIVPGSHVLTVFFNVFQNAELFPKKL